MQEIIRCVLDRLYHPWMRMTGAADTDTAHEVQKAVAIYVPDFDAAPFRHHEWVVPGIGRRRHSTVTRE